MSQSFILIENQEKKKEENLENKIVGSSSTITWGKKQLMNVIHNR